MVLTPDPLWYKDGIIYQVHIKAFKDHNNDGIGDFKGLIEKLDYIKNLGITILWVLPFYPSPLKDDGYDIADYLNINPDYGTLEDFQLFLKEAHQLELKVVTELVLNHTSDQHEWFQEARNSPPGSSKRDFYVWSDTQDKYKEARIIFQDFEVSNWTWDHKAKAYYWHRFYSHQPDLNFDNIEVHNALFKVLNFWFDMGVDGLRLDAVPYLYEREGTNCENLPETHQFLKKLNAYVKGKYPDRMLLAEANQWPEDAVAYFGDGDECQMAFHFPLMPRIYMATQMEERFPIIDILEQTPPIPENCQWAMFLRNHDELTLEMVTDEERDYMYRFYAKEGRARINLGIRRRLAPLIENNRRKIELMNILLFSFPGTPIIYYGDEIGMGDNFYLGDRNGVRTPMQWSPDRNAGFSNANPQKLFLPVIIDPEYHYETVNVEVQRLNPSSLLRWMQKAMSIRKRYTAFGRGTLEFLNPANSKVLAFLRKYQEQVILIVANLSRFSQAANLELSHFGGYVPIEAFSRNRFPIIKDSSYLLTLGPYDSYWFILESQNRIIEAQQRKLEKITLMEKAEDLFTIDYMRFLEERILHDYIIICQWYKGDRDKIQNVKFNDVLTISGNRNFILFFKINYINEQPEYYFLPLTFIPIQNSSFFNEFPFAVLSEATISNEDYYLIDGFYNHEFRLNLLESILSRKKIDGNSGSLIITIKPELQNIDGILTSKILKDLQQEVVIEYGDKYRLKLYRKTEEGINPGIELPAQLQNSAFENIIPYLGNLKYQEVSKEFYYVGLLSEYVTSQGTAWSYFSDAVKKYYDNVRSRIYEPGELSFKHVFDKPELAEVSPVLCDSIDKINTEMIKILALRTAEFQLVNSSSSIPDFAPDSFSMLYQRSIYQSIRTLLKNTFRLLNQYADQYNEKIEQDMKYIISNEKLLLTFVEKLLKDKVNAKKIRIHGNYHLGNLLFTGKDFIITNFEGNPTSAFSERRIKRSPLRDPASMIYSLHFVVYSLLRSENLGNGGEYEKMEVLARQWWLCMSSNFIYQYLNTINKSDLLPLDETQLEYLIHIYILEKALFEVKNAVENNLNWVQIPLEMLKYITSYIKTE